MLSFRGWYHCTGHTYGTWLRGDPRLWRSRKHRDDVPYDEEHPPPTGRYQKLHTRSKKLLKREPVVLTKQEQVIVCEAFREKLDSFGVDIHAIAVGSNHFHVLGNFPIVGVSDNQSPGMAIPGLCSQNALQDGRNPVPRHVMGVAKKHASHVLRSKGLAHPGGIWATRTHIEPILDEAHYLTTIDYIDQHIEEDAIVWNFSR